MARIVEPITDEQLKQITVANLRKEYKKIADFYRKIINNEIVYCSHCRNWKTVRAFYQSDENPDGIEHFACKECLLDMMTDINKYGERTDNKDKTIETFKRLDWYFDEKVYNEQLIKISENTGEKVRSTAVQQFIVMLKSFHNWDGLHFIDSVFLDDNKDIVQLTSKRKPRREIVKLFGNFPNEDLLYLQDQYDDWCARTEVDSKSQQTYIVRICFKLLDIYKAQKAGRDTEKLDKSLNELLAAANLQPRQNVGNASTDTLTFSQLIQKWEMDRPVPTPDPELCDVSGIGKKIRVWFGGWLANALGMDIPQSQEYLEEVEKYTVTKPEFEEKGNNSEIYNKMFGSEE